MKNRTFIVLLSFFLIECKSYNPCYNITFGSGFNNNNLKLYINDSLLIKNKLVRSNEITGFVDDSFVNFKNDTLFLLGKSYKIEKSILKQPNRFLKIIIEIDNKPYYFHADLKKGGNIVIEKHSYYYNVYLFQKKRIWIFE